MKIRRLVPGLAVAVFCTGTCRVAPPRDVGGSDWAWESRHLSTSDGSLPPANGGTQQTATAVFDVNGDGVTDFLIAERTQAPAVVCFLRTGNGWQRYLVEADALRIEAGSAVADIDSDGDLDVVFGGDAASNQVWWWENPGPGLQPDRPWVRRLIKDSGETKHHDQLFGDFDGDGRLELVFWNQGARALMWAEIPEHPREAEPWSWRAVYRYSGDAEPPQRGSYPAWKGVNEHEGLARADLDGDGIDDIVGGGRWFQWEPEGGVAVHDIDPGYAFSRVAVGRLIPGPRPQVVMVAGDGVAPLILYVEQDGAWTPRVLVESVRDGHSLELVDLDGDGRLDIFYAEMQLGGNPRPRAVLLRGDGRGSFHEHELVTGFGMHEARIADLDGDGDLDLLGKPYTWQAPRLDIWLQRP